MTDYTWGYLHGKAKITSIFVYKAQLKTTEVDQSAAHKSAKDRGQ